LENLKSLSRPQGTSNAISEIYGGINATILGVSEDGVQRRKISVDV
jgi:hypothetical protein